MRARPNAVPWANAVLYEAAPAIERSFGRGFLPAGEQLYPGGPDEHGQGGFSAVFPCVKPGLVMKVTVDGSEAFLVEVLRKTSPEPVLDIHRVDARRHGIHDADFVEVISRRGKVMVQCRVTEELPRGVCFLPFHWGRDHGFFKAANNLTISARDPLSRQPELKACAVRVRKVWDFPLEDN